MTQYLSQHASCPSLCTKARACLEAANPHLAMVATGEEKAQVKLHNVALGSLFYENVYNNLLPQARCNTPCRRQLSLHTIW